MSECSPDHEDLPQLLAIDREVFASLAELSDDNAFLDELIELYLKDSIQRIKTMLECAASDDSSGVEKVAHTLKSASANIGAVALARGCRDLENKLRGGTPLKGLMGLLEDIVSLHKTAVLDLRHIQGSLASASKTSTGMKQP